MGAPADSKSEQQTQNKANHEHYSTKMVQPAQEKQHKS